jgi:hypothetical protein
MKSVDEMRAEAEANWARQHALINEQRKEAGLAAIQLVHAADEAPTFSHEYQAEFRDLKKALTAGGVDAQTPFVALDSADAVSGYTGEIVVSFAFIAGSVVTGVVGAWLRKRSGRKVIIRIGDNRLEASTMEDLTVVQLNKFLHLLGAAEKMENKEEEWIRAAAAEQLLKPTFGTYEARLTICKRAYSGMIRARAQRLTLDSRAADNVDIPKIFWWAKGHQALNQNWTAGDFDTWVDSSKLTGNLHLSGGKIHLEAFNVSFLRADVETLIPTGTLVPAEVPAAPAEAPAVDLAQSTPSKGGRYPAEFWDNLWVEICRQLYEGDLKPKKQADLEKAMMDWIAERDETAGVTTVRERARKLWQAIKDGN